MEYIIFNLFSLALLIGFFVLSHNEAKNGIRLFSRERSLIDERVTRVNFVLSHVDFTAFLREIITRIAHRAIHDIVHFSLLVVRVIERFLTRIVRYLRIRHANDTVTNGNAREFVKTLSDFKGKLETTHPEVPDILSQ